MAEIGFQVGIASCIPQSFLSQARALHPLGRVDKQLVLYARHNKRSEGDESDEYDSALPNDVVSQALENDSVRQLVAGNLLLHHQAARVQMIFLLETCEVAALEVLEPNGHGELGLTVTGEDLEDDDRDNE